MLEVRDTEGRGRGVFTTDAIPAGALVHLAHVVVVPKSEVGATLDQYVYTFGDDCSVALGLGSLFNHARRPNLEFVRELSSRVIRYFAARPIGPEEELTIDYGYEPPGYVDDPGPFSTPCARCGRRLPWVNSEACAVCASKF